MKTNLKETVLISLFFILFLVARPANILAQQDSINITLVTEMREAVGWNKVAEQWKSHNNKLTTLTPHDDNNFTHITFFSVNHGKKNYIVLHIGYLNFVTGTVRQYGFVGNTLLHWDTQESDTKEWSNYYIIDPLKLKISLQENKLINNSIQFVNYGTITPNDKDNFNRVLTNRLKSDKKFKGRIHIYTLYHKDENKVCFYIEHYPSTGIGMYGQKIFEDYYYEVEYQKFIDVFGNWIK